MLRVIKIVSIHVVPMIQEERNEIIMFNHASPTLLYRVVSVILTFIDSNP
jgi:hypothetical protein